MKHCGQTTAGGAVTSPTGHTENKCHRCFQCWWEHYGLVCFWNAVKRWKTQWECFPASSKGTYIGTCRWCMQTSDVNQMWITYAHNRMLPGRFRIDAGDPLLARREEHVGNSQGCKRASSGREEERGEEGKGRRRTILQNCVIEIELMLICSSKNVQIVLGRYCKAANSTFNCRFLWCIMN